MDTPVEVIIYTRDDCHLCDEAKVVIERARAEHRLPISVFEVDVDSDPELRRLYGSEIPVVFVDGRKAFKFRVAESDFVARVERARGKRRFFR